jgi:REP element-mobilizing transposase RayT
MFRAGYTIKDQHAIHFVTFTVVQWADVFSRHLYSDIFLDSIRFCQETKNLKVHAWCIMSNHVHLICSSSEPNKLSDTIRDVKGYSSKQIIKAIQENEKESRKGWLLWLFSSAGEHNKRNKNYQFWQHTNHPIACSTTQILKSRMDYVHLNPVRANIVTKAEDYYYSSALDYYKGDHLGQLKIDYL